MTAPNDGVANGTHVHVRLGEAPTDVLCWLTRQEERAWFSPWYLAERVAPEPGMVEVVARALALLADCGYVERDRNLHRATSAGRAAVTPRTIQHAPTADVAAGIAACRKALTRPTKEPR